MQPRLSPVSLVMQLEYSHHSIDGPYPDIQLSSSQLQLQTFIDVRSRSRAIGALLAEPDGSTLDEDFREATPTVVTIAISLTDSQIACRDQRDMALMPRLALMSGLAQPRSGFPRIVGQSE